MLNLFQQAITRTNKYKKNPNNPSLKVSENHYLTSKNEMGVKITDKGGNWFGIYTKEGKIISTGFKK